MAHHNQSSYTPRLHILARTVPPDNPVHLESGVGVMLPSWRIYMTPRAETNKVASTREENECLTKPSVMLPTLNAFGYRPEYSRQRLLSTFFVESK